MKSKNFNEHCTLCGVLGTFLGGLGGVDASPDNPPSCPRMEGENGELGPDPWCSVLNRSMFLLGLIGEGAPPPPPDLAPPATKSPHPKSDPKSSDFSNLEYTSLPPPPSIAGDAFSISPNVCSRDDDRQGMNLSLQLEADLDGDEDADRFEIVLGDIDLRGDGSGFTDGGEEKVWRRKEAPDIDAGRFMPLFLLCEVSIFSSLSGESCVKIRV